MKKKNAASALATLILAGAAAPAYADCGDLWEWLNKPCRRLVDTYSNGQNELLLSGYSWHIPSTWTAERRRELNSNAWGLGLGRTVEEPNGDTHMVFAMAFEDSHKHAQLQAGYAWSTFWGPRDGLQAGLGYTALVVQRPDIAKGFPFPAVLPIATLRWQKASLVTTFIPTLNGGINHGSTLYVFGQVRLQ